MTRMERRPAPTADAFNAAVPQGTRAAIDRLGGECDRCHIGPPIRRAVTVVMKAGVPQALCEDCQQLRRLDRIADHIHGRTR